MTSMYASTVSMRVFMPSFIRCLSRPWRESSHGMSSGCSTFLRFALRDGAWAASSSSALYSAWFAVPFIQVFDSPHAMFVSVCSMIEIGLALARRERGGLGAGRGFVRARFHLLLEQHVHEHVHGLGLDDERARGPGGARVEVLVHAVVVHDGDVARLPVVADAVVDLVALAVEDVEGGLVYVAVLLALPAGA